MLEILRKVSDSTWFGFDINGPPIASQRGVTRTGLKPELNVTQCRNSVKAETAQFWVKRPIGFRIFKQMTKLLCLNTPNEKVVNCM
jgi:hypothetical protein